MTDEPPSGVVVGTDSGDRCATAVAWACAEANLHRWPLALVHVWDVPIDVRVDLAAFALPGVYVASSCRAARGDVATVLLEQAADLLVLGGHGTVRHGRRVARACLHRSTCPRCSSREPIGPQPAASPSV